MKVSFGVVGAVLLTCALPHQGSSHTGQHHTLQISAPYTSCGTKVKKTVNSVRSWDIATC